MNKSFRSKITNAKAVGSVKSGADHWWTQRVSALALIFLSLWFVLTVIKFAISPIDSSIDIIRSPFNLTMFCMFIFFALYHGYLGLKVIIEDYIHCEVMKITCIVLTKFISIASFLFFFTSIITFYFSAFI